jgi:aryl-alcohol dehydrogenase-like predicted oxidoreductase
VQRVDIIKDWAAQKIPGMPMAEIALRWVLSHDTVNTVIPGIRSIRHAELNTAPSDGSYFSQELLREMQQFSWRRNPWEQDLPLLDDIISD